MSIRDRILEAAISDEGMTEVKGNQGWLDKEFECQMRATGWMDGQAWCAYWAEKIWCEVYPDDIDRIIGRLFSANAVATYMNFKSSKFTTSNKPVVGAVVIWQKIEDDTPSFVGDTFWIRGHAGIVISVEEDSFTTLEGNSNSSGGREGIEVARQVRKYDFKKENGLELMGFIHPMEVYEFREVI